MTALFRFGARWLAYPLLALVLFVFAVHFTFPYVRLEGRIAAALGDGYEVSIGSAGPGLFPGDVVLKDVKLTRLPERPGDKPVELAIDRLAIDVGVLAAVTGELVVEVVAELGGGTIAAAIDRGSAATRVEIETHGLPLDNLPGVRSATGGVPIQGGLDASIELTLPKGRWKEAEGSIVLDCAACTIGDGVAKIRPSGPGARSSLSDGGFTLPKIKLGKIGGRVEIKKGIGQLVDLEAKSPDGDLYIEGSVRFDDPVGRSQVTAYLRYKAADELKTREPNMADLEKWGTNIRRPDGFMGVSVTGPLTALKFLGSKTSPVPSKERGDAARAERAEQKKGTARTAGTAGSAGTAGTAGTAGSAGTAGITVPSIVPPPVPVPVTTTTETAGATTGTAGTTAGATAGAEPTPEAAPTAEPGEGQGTGEAHEGQPGQPGAGDEAEKPAPERETAPNGQPAPYVE